MQSCRRPCRQGYHLSTVVVLSSGIYRPRTLYYLRYLGTYLGKVSR